MAFFSQVITELSLVDNQSAGIKRAETQMKASTAGMQKSVDGLAKSNIDLNKSSDATAASLAGVASAARNVTPAVVPAVGAVDNLAKGMAAFAVTALAGFAGAFALTIGIQALAAQVGRAFTEAAQFEQELATLNAVLNATEGASGRTADQIDALAEGISTITLATDNMVRSAAAQLLTFRSVAGDTFDRTLKAAQDLAAVGFGSIESAASTLGRALENPEEGITRLRRAGITFTQAQRDMIRNFMETGRVAEAQNLILEQLEKRVGGAGAAQASGLSGAFHRLGEATANWFEILGGNVAKAIGLQGSLEGVTEWVNKLNAAMKVSGGQASFNEQLAAAQAIYLQHREDLLKVIRAQDEMNKSVRDGTRTQQEADPALAAMRKRWEELALKFADARDALNKLKEAAANIKLSTETERMVGEWERAREKIDGVTGALNRQIKGLRLTELGERQLEAARKAGVTIMSAEGQAIATLIAQTDALAFARQRLNVTLSGVDNMRTSLMTVEQAELASYTLRLEQLRAYEDARMLMENEFSNAIQIAAFQHANALVQIAQQTAQMRLSAASSAMGEAANLLGLFAAKSKVAALAQIALNKGLAIAQAIQNTSVASTRAVAELGPVAGPPMADAIQAWGAIQVGLIAATGLAQAAGLSSSSAPTASSTSSDTSTSTTTEPEATAPVGAIEIIGIDPAQLYSGAQLRELVERLSDAVENGATLISTRNLPI